MSMYSTVEGTSSLPEMNGLPNVSQYGWTAFEIENYTQLGDYVNKCKEYFDGIEANKDYIKTMYETIYAIKSQIDIIYNSMNSLANIAKEYYDTIDRWYKQIALWESSIADMQRDITIKHGEVIQMSTHIVLLAEEVQTMHDAVMISEVNAKKSEEGAKGWFDKSYDLYLDLQKQQVYRGTWNPNSGAYPDPGGTNSYWDVILDPNQAEVDFGGHKWYFGDRLVYVLATNTYVQLEAGLANVKSVNGKTGSVTLVASDVGAYSKGEADALLAVKTDKTYVDNQLTFKVDKTTTINTKPLSDNIVLTPADIKAISSTPVTVPTSVTKLTDRSIVSANTILSISSAFTDAPAGLTTTNLKGQVRTIKRDASEGAAVIQELWTQDGISYIRIGSTTAALDSFTWNGGDANGWRKCYDTVNKPTASETGAMPLVLDDLADRHLDTFDSTKIGVYAQQFNGNTTTANGYPPKATAGVLEVLPGPYLTTYNGVIQRYTNFGMTYSWTRAKTDRGWSEWDGFPVMNIGVHYMNVLPAFDWQTTEFRVGATYLTAYSGWIGGPAEAAYTAGESVIISVDMVNQDATSVAVTLTSNTTHNPDYKIYKVLIVGAAGSRKYTVRKVHTTAQAVSINQGGTGATTADAALSALGGADVVASGEELLVLSKTNPDRNKSVKFFSKGNDIKTVGEDGTVARFYNDKTYKPTAADFGGLFVEGGNTVNFPVEAGQTTLYMNYKSSGAIIDRINFNNGRSQLNGYADIGVKNIYSSGSLEVGDVHVNHTMVINTIDGNEAQTPNGYTYLGLRDDNGNCHHYLRGKGGTNIETEGGLYVKGHAILGKGILSHNKSYGVYDLESLATWNSSAPTNHLRKVRAHDGGTIFHEAVVGDTSDPRSANGVSWWHGNGPEHWLATINQSGVIKSHKLQTYGEGDVLRIDTEDSKTAYVWGTSSGKTLWTLGKMGTAHEVELAVRHPTEPVTAGHKYTGSSVITAIHGNAITAAYGDYFRIDGSAWARNRSHYWADQWQNPAPVFVEYGAVPGANDYYPMFKGVQSYAGQGFTTSVELGMLRNGSGGRNWGDGIIRVASNEQQSANYGAIYTFGIDGVAVLPGVRTDAHGIGVNTSNGLGASAIAIGDNDTGFRWGGDGVIRLVANSDSAGYFNSSEFYYKHIRSDSGFFVPLVIHGSDKALIRGAAEGGGWDHWQARAAGLLLDCPNAETSAHNVWKATQWSRKHIAAMDVHAPDSGSVVRLVVGGIAYQFHENGQAHAPAWVSTSDIRKKTKISPLSDSHSLDIVDKIETINYALKTDEDTMNIGYSAQNLQELVPNVVFSQKDNVADDSDDILAVNYGAMSSFNTSCIKELKSIVEDQQKQIDELKKLVEALTSK